MMVKTVNWYGQWSDETVAFMIEVQPLADEITTRLKAHLEEIEAEPFEYQFMVRSILDDLFMDVYLSFWLDKLEIEREKDPAQWQQEKKV